MLHRRPTITIATSALIFLCIALHAQSGAASQKSYNDAEAYKLYESLLPTDWTVTATHAQLSPVAFHADKALAIVYMGHSCGSLCGATFHILKKKDGVWKNLHWKGTSRAWAS